MKQLSLVETPLGAKVKIAIERYQYYEAFTRGEGFYLAFSGGKDSVVIKALADMAGVKYDAHYNHTTVDPPELVRFIRSFDDVICEMPEISMWKLIEKKRMPPTRLVRYCCDKLKEGGGEGRFVVTGVRRVESTAKQKRKEVEFDVYGSQGKKAKSRREVFYTSDNTEKAAMLRNCQIKGKHIFNPIVDWTDDDVWNFIWDYDIPYCSLYDEGWTRLGCIGCPMSGKNGMIKDFNRWPVYEANYIRAFQRMVDARIRDGLETKWKTGQDVFDWWLGGTTGSMKQLEGQMKLWGLEDEEED